MNKFTTYFLMNEQDVLEYAKERLDFWSDSTNLQVKEIGDGNLNYVFRVQDESGKSIIVKQAGHTARISDEFKLSTDRVRIEAEALQIQQSFTPNLVPTIYFFDEVMSCFAMEDLGQFTIMRQALIEHRTFPDFAKHIATFMAENLLRTSDIVIYPKEKKTYVSRFINPELCEISEDLVFTEPYFNNANRNEVLEENRDFVEQQLYKNEPLHAEVAKLKYAFLTKSQSLLHGDLHTGSIFISEKETKVIDPEFAFYGPMGYDVGNVIANLTFAWANGVVTKDENFTRWVENAIAEVVDEFKLSFVKVWGQYATEMFATQCTAFQQAYLLDVLKDSAGMAGLEINRRIVGLAKVKDITSLKNDERIIAERMCITAANQMIMNQQQFMSGIDYLRLLQEVKEQLA